jgi:hypothetical protein
MAVLRKLSKYKLHLEEVRWEGGGTESAGEYTLYMEREMRIMNWVQDFVHKRIRGLSLLVIGCHT